MKLRSVKILSDENISPKVVRALRDLGMDVLDVKEQHWHGKEDQKLMDIAYRDKRFIITHDSGYRFPLTFPLFSL